ncbi:MAG: TMEM175 family protein [Bacteroidia bacterium]
MQKTNYTYDKKRFEAFFDAIVAIILTILVLELRIPEAEEAGSEGAFGQVKALLPSFISYIGSFLLIAGIWLDHHILMLNTHSISKRYILLNMLFILSLSIVPFTTAFAGNNSHDSFAVALLALNYFVMNVFFGSLYWYGNKTKMINSEFFKDNKSTAIYSAIGIIALLASIPLAYLNTNFSFGIFIITFLGHLLKKK